MAEKTVLVACAIIEHDGKILAVQRSERMNLPLNWEFPGGKIHPGETPAECAVREVGEELGIEIAILGELLRRPYDYADRKVDLWFFVARKSGGVPQALGCREWRWVTPEELAAYPLPDASQPIVAALRDGGWLATSLEAPPP